MVKCYVRVYKAFDSSANGRKGKMGKDMSRIVASGSVEARKAEKAVEAALTICEAYVTLNPEASVMPSIRVTSGRKPNGFDKMTEASNPAMRKFLKRETETV